VNDTVVISYDAQTGHQLGETFHLPGSPLGLEILSSDWPTDHGKDIVTLSSGGYIRRFHHLELVWENIMLIVPLWLAELTIVSGEPQSIWQHHDPKSTS
jgi:hypothetical protein